MKFQSLEGIFGFFNLLVHLRGLAVLQFQSLEGIFGFFNAMVQFQDKLIGELVSIPRRDFWVFQLDIDLS
ncbi:hypothetical protein CKA32_000676 [Geitlerinema sp. FC II]|nr:hypothetical protein CKA32_000676 [Geitlerinema sp. FC II]